MMNQLAKSRPPNTLPTSGMMMSLTSESTIFPNAAPMITATARSITLPLTAKPRNSLSIDMEPPRSMGRGCLRTASDGGLPGFAGANADHLLDRGHEDLAVTDLAGARGLHDRLDRALGERIGDHGLDLHLGQEIDDVLGAAIKLGMAFLASEALDLGDGEPGDAQLGQRLADFIELERLDDGFDFFHGGTPGRKGVSPAVTAKLTRCPGTLLARLVRRQRGPLVPRRRDRVAPILAESARRDADAHGGLAPLVLADLDKPYNLGDRLCGITHGHDFTGTAVMFDIGLEDAVEHVIGRQRILVGLVGTQFRRRRPGDDALRNHAAEAVAVMAKPVDERLGNVLQHAEATRHVAIERGI